MSSNQPSSCITSGSGCSSATNYPQFIDTSNCLCGLLNSRAPNRNGNTVQVWRCISNANNDVNSTSNNSGEWYYTQLPSEELSGIAQKQNWNQNPPDTKTVYTLTSGNNNVNQYTAQSGNSQSQDSVCTGTNSTQMSAQYYSNSKKVSSGGGSPSPAASSGSSSKSHASSTTSRGSSSSQVATSSSTSTTITSASPASTLTGTRTASTTTSDSGMTTVKPTSGNDAVSTVPSLSLKSFCLLSVLVVPVILGLA